MSRKIYRGSNRKSDRQSELLKDGMDAFKKKRRPLKRGEFMLRFGKHKGKRLRDVPTDYLEWMLEEFTKTDKNKELLHHVRLVVNHRKRPKPSKKPKRSRRPNTGVRLAAHPIPDDVVLDPNEECPFECDDDELSELDREFRDICGF